MNISNFLENSESEYLGNLALLLEKTLNDKILLSEKEKESLNEIMHSLEEVEVKIYKLAFGDIEEK